MPQLAEGCCLVTQTNGRLLCSRPNLYSILSPKLTKSTPSMLRQEREWHAYGDELLLSASLLLFFSSAKRANLVWAPLHIGHHPIPLQYQGTCLLTCLFVRSAWLCCYEELNQICIWPRSITRTLLFRVHSFQIALPSTSNHLFHHLLIHLRSFVSFIRLIHPFLLPPSS